MNKLLLIQAILMSLAFTSSFSQGKQDINYSIRDFFVMDYWNSNNETRTWVRPDSLKNNSAYEEFGAKMYNFLEFLLQHYSDFDYEYNQHLNSLLPDKKKIEREFEQTLVSDTLLNKFFNNTITRKNIGEVSIDTIQKIISRFFYLHRYTSGKYKGELELHVCIEVNEVFELPQNEKSPYLNSFCWTIVRTNGDLMELVFKEIKMANQLDKTITDEELNRHKNDNYKKIIANEEVRKIIVSEYEKRKEYLNFELVY